MGVAIAQRLGPGATVLLADVNRSVLAAAAERLRASGYQVVDHVVDVSDADSVAALAETASGLGRVEVLVHTAGVSPVQASVETILRVDLLGAALMLDAFATVVSPGSAGVFIASMAGTMFGLDVDVERRLTSTPAGALLSLPELTRVPDAGTAYGIAKRATQLRVRAAWLAWGKHGARVNSISPGVISTPMGAAELEGPNGELIRSMLANSPTARVGTAHDVAAAVEFLTGPQSTYITGTDLLVDGGVIAGLLAPAS